MDYKGDGPWKKCPLCFTLIAIKVRPGGGHFVLWPLVAWIDQVARK